MVELQYVNYYSSALVPENIDKQLPHYIGYIIFHVILWIKFDYFAGWIDRTIKWVVSEKSIINAWISMAYLILTLMAKQILAQSSFPSPSRFIGNKQI